MVFGLFKNNTTNNAHDKKEDHPVPMENVLMEVVSARDLVHQKSLLDQQVDPYCCIRVHKKEVHRTATIYNDPDPIWTVKTGSLCLLQIPIANESNISSDDDGDNAEEHAVVVEVCHGMQCLGIVCIPFPNVLSCNGDRVEYPIGPRPLLHGKMKKDDNETMERGSLVLRFRKATLEDLIFLKKEAVQSPPPSPPDPTTTTMPTMSSSSSSRPKDDASDINLLNVKDKNLFQFYSKRELDTVKFRVQPYPNPNNVEQTTWMTKEEIDTTSLEPSTKWVEAGDGTIGRVYVEIIACDGLPNMDMVGVGDASDVFVGIVFEDTMVRTNVIYDSNSPRWMPWCTRAFCFNIQHPSSLIFLGVLDYDPAPIKNHDPIGRVVINTANFQSNTSYLLHYAIHDDPNQEDDRGTIIIRLRVEWKSESEARKVAFKLPPRFLINVENQRAFYILKYICRGRVNMEQASLDSVRFYANELMSYGEVYCYLIDVMIGVLLWRGRAKLSFLGKKFSLWFPIHSVALLSAGVVAIESPTMIPAVFFFGIAYIMLAMNYYGTTYPYPWNRCKSWHETNMVLALGRSVHPPIRIAPYTGIEEAAAREALDKVKGQRVMKFLLDAKTVGLKVRKIYAKSSVGKIAIETEEEQDWFADTLLYVHMFLFYLCTYLRLWRNFCNWKGYYTHKLVLTCLFLGLAWIVLPMHLVILWTLRFVAWTVLGPWMKLMDIWYVHPRYRTTEEILEDPTVKDTGLESILTSQSLKDMGKSARLASEEALKLKDMREAHFGKYSQLVPFTDFSRHPYIPLADSSAEPYCNGDVSTTVPMERVSGQKLKGHMIPSCSLLVP